MTSVYSVNDYVRYASNGICKISAITVKKFHGNTEGMEYYVLNPISNPQNMIYVPTGNEHLTSKMCRILSKAELNQLIMSSKIEEMPWLDDRKERNELFSGVLSRCDQQELLKLIRCIYARKHELLELDRKLSSTDEGVLKQAENMIQSDFSFMLGISENEVASYVRELLDINEDLTEN